MAQELGKLLGDPDLRAGDQLLKGAALDAGQTAETLLAGEAGTFKQAAL